jgi:hypothetical protein
MVNDTYLSFLLQDDKSLACYAKGEVVSFSKIKQNLFLLKREQNKSVPDHYYRLEHNVNFENIGNLCSLLTCGLAKIADNNLYILNKKNYVKKHRFEIWQNQITQIPPLVLQAIKIHISYPLKDLNPSSVNNYYLKYLKPNFLHTAIPHPHIEGLNILVRQKFGFHDLHVHLNGATEADIIWQDFLKSPELIYNQLKEGFKKANVTEQYEQESFLLKPLNFYKLLKIARKIRRVFFNLIFEIKSDEIIKKSIEQLINNIVYTDNFETGYQNFKHPFANLIKLENRDINENNLAIEALMYVLIFNELEHNRREGIASLFHFYLLIQGLSNRLLVQQIHQNGFEQFEKHTVNNLRELTEKKYTKRFFQMHGNESRNLHVLEGRFSPKETEFANIELIDNINCGWAKFQKEKINHGKNLNLVAHFIKKKEDEKSDYIRHNSLRIDVNNRANVLNFLIKKGVCKLKIVGIDAAANELYTPPEVFAPTFRQLRRTGNFKHFTYHVGEDFYHIVGGLRAIYEAIFFNELSNGDRLGHATAAGINSKYWNRTLRNKMLIKKGEWLDDLIFSYHLIKIENINELGGIANQIKNVAELLILDIYKIVISIEDYIQAWLTRKYCPILAFSENLQEARIKSVFNIHEFFEIQKEISIDSIKILKLYHSKRIRKEFEVIMEINTVDIFSHDAIETMQLKLLELISNKGLVLEALPTSNIRISHYEDYSEYHLLRWRKWEEDGKIIPKIVIGSDDTGIFATSIFNEYAHIYCQLIENGLTNAKAILYLKELCQNAQKFKFS